MESKVVAKEEKAQNMEADFTDVSSENIADISVVSDADHRTAPAKIPCTPAIQRLRSTLNHFHVQSPSDAIVSPVTQKLSASTRYRKAQGHQKSVVRRVDFGHHEEQPSHGYIGEPHSSTSADTHSEKQT